MKMLPSFAFAGAVAFATLVGTVPSMAEDCDAIIGEIDQLLESATLTPEQKDQVMQLRDQGQGENTRAGGDCTTPLSEALNILKGE